VTLAAVLVALAAVLVALAAAVAVAYWLLAVSEGAYLGPRVVLWLYDRGAATYDGVKRFQPHDEAAHIANPLVTRLEDGAGPGGRVLDVATGTGRAAVALLMLDFYHGTVVGLDLSRRMLEQAAVKTEPWRERFPLLRAPAVPLPFSDGAFDAVVMLEALEFLPDRERAVRELARVLAPGGWLLLSNRVGLDRWLLAGRVDAPEGLVRRLLAAGLTEVSVCGWETYYDLVWARKPGAPCRRAEAPDAWLVDLRCPACGATGEWRSCAPEQAEPKGERGAAAEGARERNLLRWRTADAGRGVGVACHACGRSLARDGVCWDLAPGGRTT